MWESHSAVGYNSGAPRCARKITPINCPNKLQQFSSLVLRITPNSLNTENNRTVMVVHAMLLPFTANSLTTIKTRRRFVLFSARQHRISQFTSDLITSSPLSPSPRRSRRRRRRHHHHTPHSNPQLRISQCCACPTGVLGVALTCASCWCDDGRRSHGRTVARDSAATKSGADCKEVARRRRCRRCRRRRQSVGDSRQTDSE